MGWILESEASVDESYIFTKNEAQHRPQTRADSEPVASAPAELRSPRLARTTRR
jgi:hypothetical protein